MIRQKLINAGANLTLDKAIQIAQAWEYSQAQKSAMGSAPAQPTQQDVHTVKRQPQQQNSGETTVTFGIRFTAYETLRKLWLQ